jgi:putative selenium metabolism protein SsnA
MLANGIVVTGFCFSGEVKPQVILDGGIVWCGTHILGIGAEPELRRRYPDARILDAHGGLILPGLINLHHHFYSALARGLNPEIPIRTFAETLNGLWWRLDRALDPEAIRVSAQLIAADCIRWGCTTVFDHHASPSCASGSLDILAEVLDAAGLCAVLCYEVSDRNGHAAARAGIEENVRFLREHRGDPYIRGALGLHASFTLREETLKEAAKRLPADAGCHIHIAEDPIDRDASMRAFGASPMERLERHGLLGPRCLLAHGIHLNSDEYARVARHESNLIHNPESNANNAVGHLDVASARDQGCLIGLGTDGISSSMLGSLRAAVLMQRAAGACSTASLRDTPDFLHNNVVVARRFFDEPLLGELAPGAPADIIVVDAPPYTPICPDSVLSHLVFGAAEAPVRHTIARGRILLEDFCHKTIDPVALTAHARQLAPGLWQRFHDLRTVSDFLGEKRKRLSKQQNKAPETGN